MTGRRAAVVGVVVLALAAFGFAKLASNNGPATRNPAFGHGLSNVAVSTATKIRLSPDGTRVALVEDGAVTVVRAGDGSRVMTAGRNVVDAAWMPDGGRVVIVEGPIPTGEIAAIDMRGRAVGTAKLSPPVEFGDGYGLAVNSDGTRVAAIAVTREAIGGVVHTDVAEVNLQTGATNVLATPADERNPIFLADDSIGALSGGRFFTFDAIGGPFVLSPGGEAVVEGAGHRLFAIDPSTSKKRTLRSLPRGHVPVDVDAHLTRALVRVTDRDGTVHLSFDPLT